MKPRPGEAGDVFRAGREKLGCGGSPEMRPGPSWYDVRPRVSVQVSPAADPERMNGSLVGR